MADAANPEEGGGGAFMALWSRRGGARKQDRGFSARFHIDAKEEDDEEVEAGCTRNQQNSRALSTLHYPVSSCPPTTPTLKTIRRSQTRASFAAASPGKMIITLVLREPDAARLAVLIAAIHSGPTPEPLLRYWPLESVCVRA